MIRTGREYHDSVQLREAQAARLAAYQVELEKSGTVADSVFTAGVRRVKSQLMLVVAGPPLVVVAIPQVLRREPRIERFGPHEAYGRLRLCLTR